MENIEPDEIKSTQVENVEIIPKTKHLCWLYENDEDRLSVVAPFLVAALSRRKQCLLVVTKAVREGTFLDLIQGDVNVARYQEIEQMIHIEPEEVLFNGGGVTLCDDHQR